MSKITYGTHTYGVENIKLCGTRKTEAKIYIGNFCSIGANLRIYLGGNHRTEWVTTYPFGHIKKGFWCKPVSGHPKTNGDVNIGNDVWIGDNVTIMSGVNVGSGAVIACNSHVTRDIGNYQIHGGNPAELINYRFDIETVDKLLDVKWWDWSDDKIKQAIPYLCSDDIDKFLEYAEKS